MLVGPDRRDRYEAVRKRTGGELKFTLAGDGEDGDEGADAGAGYEWLADITGPSPSLPDVELSQADTLAMIYTSGTTGIPKGVRLPHGRTSPPGPNWRSVSSGRPTTTCPTRLSRCSTSSHSSSRWSGGSASRSSGTG